MSSPLSRSDSHSLVHPPVNALGYQAITTAVPLTTSLQRSLREVASELTGKEARLGERIDESILGGMILEIEDRKIDTSVAKEIRRLSQQLLDTASREIQSGKRWEYEV